jgi:hypothetical protein
MAILVLLNVILGMIFAWSLLSLAAMNIQEWVAARRSWRSRMLESSLQKMFTDPVLVEQFYQHPLILSLFTGKENRNKPSYIPPVQFSQAVIDMLSTTGTEASLLQHELFGLVEKARRLGPRARRESLKRLDLILGMVRKALVCETGEETVGDTLELARQELEAFANEVKPMRRHIEAAQANVSDSKEQVNAALARLVYEEEQSEDTAVNQVRAGVTALSVTHPQLKQSLYAILHSMPATLWQKENELELIRQNLEAWFNANMDRLTGWYRRRAQAMVFAISLLLALVVNLDSIHLAGSLWKQPDLREAFSSQLAGLIGSIGSQSAAAPDGQWQSLQSLLGTIDLPVGWIGTPVEMRTAAAPDVPAGACTLFPAQENDIYGVLLSQQCYPLVNTPLLQNMTGWLLKFLGFLVTGLAASQGAPFWFDILKKFVNVRLTGLRPAESTGTVG